MGAYLCGISRCLVLLLAEGTSSVESGFLNTLLPGLQLGLPPNLYIFLPLEGRVTTCNPAEGLLLSVCMNVWPHACI